jgi:hypothetical protein
MMPNRTTLRMAIGVLVMLAAVPAFAQGIGGAQFFAPADISPYGRGPQPNQGYFFVFDGLYWSVSQPHVSKIGDEAKEQLYPQSDGSVLVAPILPSNWSSTDTGLFTAPFNPGQRVEFGRVEEHQGWFVSTFRLNDQTQDPTAYNVPVVYKDPSDILKGAAVRYTTLDLYNENTTWNIELNYLYRFLPFHNNGVAELFLGVRYMEFNEMFKISGVGGALDWTFILTDTENHLLAPQIGLRFFKKYASRFMFSAEGRFFEGFNSLNVSQYAVMGFNQSAPLGNTATTHVFNGSWYPAVEARFDIRYQLTRAISFRAGWTGMWLDGIARASNVNNYELPNMGINLDNRHGLFINGLTLGIDVNR